MCSTKKSIFNNLTAGGYEWDATAHPNSENTEHTIYLKIN